MNIKKIRESHGLTQEQFAKRLHVSSATVQAWEQGINAVTPAIKRLINLTEFVGGFDETMAN